MNDQKTQKAFNSSALSRANSVLHFSSLTCHAKKIFSITSIIIGKL